jgi:type IV fimbrial biogenesis protein FimT
MAMVHRTATTANCARIGTAPGATAGRRDSTAARRRILARRRTALGITLVELTIGLALVGLLLVIAMPGYRTWIATYELRSTAEQLANSLMLARTEAIKRGHRVNLCKSTDRRRCADTGDWDRGWLLFADVDRDGQVDGDDVPLRTEDLAAPDITIRANRPLDDYVSYTGLGHARLLNGALQMGTFVVCRPGQSAIHVVLANSGRVRTERTRDPC